MAKYPSNLQNISEDWKVVRMLRGGATIMINKHKAKGKVFMIITLETWHR